MRLPHLSEFIGLYSSLLDPKTVPRGPKRRVFDLPGGAPRLTTDALGVRGVWVNGRRVVGSDGPLDSPPRAGEVLTSFSP
jgi:N-acyl-D-amino-acid deacylase